MGGNVGKDSMYLTRIKNETAKNLQHPRHHGIAMQAHHAISAKGVRLSMIGRKLERFRYDINLLPNLVFIPSTLQGACHLGVQPHRGDHTTMIPSEEEDDDDTPMTYHLLVAARVVEVSALLTGKCPKRTPGVVKELAEKMNSVSEGLIELIQKLPAIAPLTRVAGAFGPLSHKGCSGVDSVAKHQGERCPVERDHERRQGPNQEREGITLRKPLLYVLKAGQ